MSAAHRNENMATAIPRTGILEFERASQRIRQVQEEIRAIIRDDQTDPKIGYSICEALAVVEQQIDRIAGLQELFEWYLQKPAL